MAPGSVEGVHGQEGQGGGCPRSQLQAEAAPSPAPISCPPLSCPPERPALPLHPWAGTEYQFVSLS